VNVQNVGSSLLIRLFAKVLKDEVLFSVLCVSLAHTLRTCHLYSLFYDGNNYFNNESLAEMLM